MNGRTGDPRIEPRHGTVPAVPEKSKTRGAPLGAPLYFYICYADPRRLLIFPRGG